MDDIIHLQLEKMKIPHVCHYRLSSGFDLTFESIACTECCIERGDFSLADIVTGKVDPMDTKLLWDKAVEEYELYVQLRKEKKLPKHVIGSSNRFSCLDGDRLRASGPIPENRKCFNCKESIDE